MSKRRSVPWSDFAGIFSSKGGRTFTVAKSDECIVPPAISFNSLPELEGATSGLILDPVASTHMAENDKVEVFDRNGCSVIKKVGEVEADARPKGDASAE